MTELRKPIRPYILGKGKPNKYNRTSLDGHRVLASGAIVARTVSVAPRNPKTGKCTIMPVDESYDNEMIDAYKTNLDKYNKQQAKKSKKAK